MRRRAAESETGEGGFTLLELVVALSLLAAVTMGFSLTVGSGFRAVAVARQRQTASDLLSARIEHLRNIPYSQVALSSQPVHATSASDPDSFVDDGGTTYDVTGHDDREQLIVDTAAGAVLHFEDPVRVSTTLMRIYQYVTWVDDPAVVGTQDYRRVTVVAQFKAPASNGVNQIVRMSSLFTPGTITVGASPGGATSTTIAGATTTTTAPPSTTTTTVAGITATTVAAACATDTTPPTGSFTMSASTVSSEVGYTAAPNVSVHLAIADVCTPLSARLSNDGTTFGSPVAYDAQNTSLSWSLAGGDGTKTVDVTVADGAGNTTALAAQTIVLDATKPTVPGTLTRTVACSGTNRTVTLRWGIAADAWLHGYRVYTSTDGVSWRVVGTTSSFTWSDNHHKNLDSVRYRVVAYDRAGNESDATNVVSLAKNQCS